MRLIALSIIVNYNNLQVVNILITFSECGRCAAETARILNERHPG